MTETSTETKKPQDHKPKAKKKPPADQPRTVTLDGHDYVIDPARMDDLEFLEAYEDQRWVAVLRLMLGPQQWTAFKVNHQDDRGRITGAKFQQIIEDLDGSDLDLGNF